MLKGKFKVPIYDIKVEVHEGNPYEEAKRLKWEMDDIDRLKTADSGVFWFVSGYCFVILSEGAPIGRVISHEIHHLTDKILDWVGVEHTPCSEAHAYLHGWLMDKVLKLINKGEK